MKIKKASFAGSSTTLKGKPLFKAPEIAFIGRSNVGKSSLINMLCHGAAIEGKGGELARTSSSPGKTIAVNHFLINDSWYLVDLPGYGYAKLSKTQIAELAKMNNEFINSSEQLATLFVLIDGRLPLQRIDSEFITSLGRAQIPFAIILTKADKLSKNEISKNFTQIKNELLKQWEELPPIFLSSATTHQGKEEILNYIEQVITLYKNSNK